MLDAFSNNIHKMSQCKLLYADDLITISVPLENLHKLLQLWKFKIEAKGLRVHITKMKVMMTAMGLEPTTT